LTGNWQVAWDDLQRLKESIDAKGGATPLQQLQQRVWLIHWSLFVFFNHPKGRDGIIDMFFQPQFINTIQTSCPWILRYLTCAVMANRRRRQQIKDILRVIRHEAHDYSDPITQFVECLYSRFDFEEAKDLLQKCTEVLANDFFLLPTMDDFIENARCFIAETFCKIYSKIDVLALSRYLNMAPEEGEKWIVNLVRDSRIDAKIDFSLNIINVNNAYPTVYQSVIEKTKGLAFKSQVLSAKIDKRQQANLKTQAAARANAVNAAGALEALVEQN